MLLKTAVATTLTLALAVAAGCGGVGLDREYCVDASIAAQATVNPDAVRERQKDAALVATGADRPTLFGRLMPDRSGRLARLERESRRAEAPFQPSIGEQRRARAEAIARVDIQRRSLGDTTVRTDGSSSKAGQVEFVAAPNALTLYLDVSPNLNECDGVPHALVLTVYQLSDTTQYNALAGHDQGIDKLLEGKAFHRSVKAVDTVVVQPGTSSTVVLDRPDGARTAALAAGYAEVSRGARTATMQYGVGRYKIQQAAFRRPVDMYAPLPLTLNVTLGPDGFAVYDLGNEPSPLITRAPRLPDQIQTIY